MAATGLVYSWWALAALPAAVLTSFAFAAAGLACTTYMRTWQDSEFVSAVTLPMFLFSTTFYPLSVYPRPLQFVVERTPLYQSVVLLRDLTLGTVGPGLLVDAAYLAVLGAIGLLVAGRRIGKRLLGAERAAAGLSFQLVRAGHVTLGRAACVAPGGRTRPRTA